MKKLLGSAAFVAIVIASGSAFADNPFSQTVQVSAIVDNAVYVSGTQGAGTVAISSFAGSDGKAAAGTATYVAATELTATGQVKVKVSSATSGYLSIGGATGCSAEGATCVPYAATATFAVSGSPISATANTTTPDAKSTATTTGAGALNLDLAWASGTVALNSGSFQDTLTVEVGPNV